MNPYEFIQSKGLQKNGQNELHNRTRIPLPESKEAI